MLTSPSSLGSIQHRLGDDVQKSIIKLRDPALLSQRSVAIINTGGTISMTANSSGALEPCPGYLAQRLSEMQEMQRAETPATTLFELLPLIDSSDMNSDDWIRIASLIEALYHDFDAFVVIMGTDTMAYAASALSFILEDLGKMVVLTGSMLPLSDLFNDAQRNLVVSVVMAATLDVPEVCVFMDDQLLRGNRTVKSNSGGLDAFESPNYPSIAKLETGIRFRRNAALALPKGRFRVHKNLVTNIAVWRMIPGFDDEYIFNSIQHSTSLRAIVLELYGTGNLSSRKQSLLEALAAAMEKGIVIVATSQCLRGSVDLKAYALGRNLEAIGVVSGLDMTTEAVVTKLAYLLSWPDANPSLIAHYMGKNLRGEVTESQQKGPVFAQSSGANENSNGEVFITTASISKAVQRSRSGKLLEYPTTPVSSGHASGIKLKTVSGMTPALSSPQARSAAVAAASTTSITSSTSMSTIPSLSSLSLSSPLSTSLASASSALVELREPSNVRNIADDISAIGPLPLPTSSAEAAASTATATSTSASLVQTENSLLSKDALDSDGMKKTTVIQDTVTSTPSSTSEVVKVTSAPTSTSEVVEVTSAPSSTSEVVEDINTNNDNVALIDINTSRNETLPAVTDSKQESSLIDQSQQQIPPPPRPEGVQGRQQQVNPADVILSTIKAHQDYQNSPSR